MCQTPHLLLSLYTRVPHIRRARSFGPGCRRESVSTSAISHQSKAASEYTTGRSICAVPGRNSPAQKPHFVPCLPGTSNNLSRSGTRMNWTKSTTKASTAHPWRQLRQPGTSGDSRRTSLPRSSGNSIPVRPVPSFGFSLHSIFLSVFPSLSLTRIPLDQLGMKSTPSVIIRREPKHSISSSSRETATLKKSKNRTRMRQPSSEKSGSIRSVKTSGLPRNA